MCSGGSCGAAGEKVFARELPALGNGNGEASKVALGLEIDGETRTLAEEFFARALAEDLSPSDVFRITTTSFMDAYNFDVRQVMKSCVHHVLPSGHLIPFSAYNVLYRDGHVPLPQLGHARTAPAASQERALT